MQSPPVGFPLRRTPISVFPFAFLPAILMACWGVLVAGSLCADEPATQYTEVKSLLKERCFACHGVLQQQGDLRLDSGELIRRGGDSGAAVVIGDAATSLLIQRIADPDPDTRMPPEGEPLSEAEIALLSRWIDQGAITPADDQPEQDPRFHWAFQPIRRPPVPSSDDATWGRNPIDAFILADHNRLGLTPQVTAAAPLRLRRLYIDLVGLPPSAQELFQWLGAHGDGTLDDEAYQTLVEHLLNDPRHGERWARHWMDIWRYSDWWGLGNQLRNSQQHMWHWRDWIVESLNADLPYDAMVRLMLAGDEIAADDIDQLRATGYLARNFFLFNRHQWMDETVEHVSKGFLGLTMNCSKCHDHKYDPLPQTDYYRMRAFFEPYHVRLDLLPGEPNYDRNALPRVFDALLDAPTFRFIRGEETNPDPSQAIAPGVPDILAFRDISIQPVTLPPEAYQPERRPWVQAIHLAQARQKVAESSATIESAEQEQRAAASLHEEMLAKTRQAADTPATSDGADKPGATEELFSDDFERVDPLRWKLVDGNWDHQPGRLRQTQDGAQRAAVRLQNSPPRDFEATLEFTTIGGSKWRSVGISFDIDAEQENTKSADDQHLHVYVSAVAGGAKVQVAYRKSGVDHYPSEAMRGMPIQLDKRYTLRVRVRDSLINVDLDGKAVVAWRSPMPRREGVLQLTTFDALADFHQFSLRPLDPAAQLQEPGNDLSHPTTVEQSELRLQVAGAKVHAAQLAKAYAEAELASLEKRLAALALAWASDPPDAGANTEADSARVESARAAAASHVEAIRSQRVARVAQLRLAHAELEVQRWVATDDKRAGLDGQLAESQQRLDQAIAALDAAVTQDDQIDSIVGAKWSATRFLNSGADDPAIGFPATSSGRRTALADWIVDRDNPLTARVAVNHIWARHFGTPLVASVFDFGRNGTPPTHPNLLDWLASELIDSGWSMKHIHRLIVSSSTYQMSSSKLHREHEATVDPDNRYLWRREPIRVESQVVRDAVLSLAGTLDLTPGGPSVPLAQQTQSQRRSLYFFHSNNERNLFLTTFDEAAVKECYRRDESIVPQQALAMTNSRLVLDAIGPIAANLHQALATESGGSDAASERRQRARFIELAFLSLLGFAPNDQEIAASQAAWAQWRQLPESSESLARSYLIWTLLNHNDFVTLR